jgi:predicted transcriptional regulator
MEIVWKKGEATVGEVVEALGPDTPLAYSTVLTTLRILENKGYLRHRKDGRAFVYKPAVRRDKAQDSAIKHLLKRFFEDSAELLVLNLLERKQITPEQLARLRARIEEEKKR